MTRRARLLIHLAVLFGASPALAAETAGARAGWLGLMDPYVLLVIGSAITVAAIAAALISLRRLRRAFDLQRDIFGAVPQPRQVVGRHGRTVVANTAFYDFSRGVDRPTPDLLVEQVGGDDEARDQIARLAANARNGRAGYAELRVGPRAAGGSPGGEDDGQAEWRYVAAYPVSGRPGTVLWMVDDITLRHQMEQVIRGEQERFVDLLEHAPIGFYSVDGAGRFLFANRTLCDWIGLSHDDLASGAVRLHDVIAESFAHGDRGARSLGQRYGYARRDSTQIGRWFPVPDLNQPGFSERRKRARPAHPLGGTPPFARTRHGRGAGALGKALRAVLPRGAGRHRVARPGRCNQRMQPRLRHVARKVRRPLGGDVLVQSGARGGAPGDPHRACSKRGGGPR